MCDLVDTDTDQIPRLIRRTDRQGRRVQSTEDGCIFVRERKLHVDMSVCCVVTPYSVLCTIPISVAAIDFGELVVSNTKSLLLIATAYLVSAHTDNLTYSTDH